LDYDLHLGDMREVLRTFEAESIDSIVSDPPYGLSFMGKGWDRGVPGAEFWQEALRVAKPGAHLLAFGGTRTYHRLICAIEDAGWEIRDCIMWVHSQGFPKSHNLKGEWQGWGTTLKPAWEPIIVARKPLEGTVAQNVLKHGTGGMNIDGCRVGTDLIEQGRAGRSECESDSLGKKLMGTSTQQWQAGRWPANLIHDGSEEVLALFPAQAGGGFGVRGGRSSEQLPGLKATYEQVGFGDSGSAARFFYCAKASKKDRGADNPHPCVKPTDLMRYCVKLVTPPGGVVLDPFMGSGSTGKAAMLEGMNFIGVDLDPEYLRIADSRISHALKNQESKC
jgi:DNA modification methylase